jgi:hypothetical protein
MWPRILREVSASDLTGRHAPPISFDAAQSKLATGYNIHVRPLAASVAVAVSQQQAEAAALNRVGEVSTPGVTSFAVSARKGKHPKVSTSGHAPLIPSGSVWLVLVPDQQVAIRGRPGPPFSYTATLAVLIDANSGDYLMTAALSG